MKIFFCLDFLIKYEYGCVRRGRNLSEVQVVILLELFWRKKLVHKAMRGILKSIKEQGFFFSFKRVVWKNRTFFVRIIVIKDKNIWKGREICGRRENWRVVLFSMEWSKEKYVGFFQWITVKGKVFFYINLLNTYSGSYANRDMLHHSKVESKFFFLRKIVSCMNLGYASNIDA